MRLADSIRSRIAMLFQRSQMRAEMEEELRSHIQHRADDLERSGMGRSEAERRARIEFGGREKYKEQIHQAIGGDLIETCVQDLRFSLRQLRKSPAFTCAAVMTLALAIGANAVVFGLMDGLILRPLNVPQYKTLYGMDEVEARDTARQRFNMVLLTIFGIAGLLMGAIGVYGVMSHSVQQRTQEMGVRMALGAQTSDLRRMVIAQGMRLALFGLSAGLGGAFYLTRFLSSFLFGIKPWDPVAFIFTPATSRCSCIFCHLDPGTQSNSHRSNDGAQARIAECSFNSSKRESQCLFVGD